MTRGTRGKLLAAAGGIVSACLAGAAGRRLVRRLKLEPARVAGDSMGPRLRAGDRIAVTQPGSVPPRGAVVVVRAPGGGGLEVVKRVVGLPGELLADNGTGVTIGSVPLIEPWREADLRQDPPWSMAVPAGHVAVLGDRRSASTDSRTFGPVPVAAITGVVKGVYWPPSRWGPVGPGDGIGGRVGESAVMPSPLWSRRVKSRSGEIGQGDYGWQAALSR